MAEPRRQQSAAPAVRDRKPDVETLAATIFVQKLAASAGSREPGTLARESLSAARAFFMVCDELPTEKG